VAAKPTTDRMPKTNSAAAVTQRSSNPVSQRTGIMLRQTPRPTLAQISSGFRRKRSTYAPTIKPNSAYGRNWAAFTRPTSNGLACSTVTTRTGTATALTADPNEETVAADQYERNPGTRRSVVTSLPMCQRWQTATSRARRFNHAPRLGSRRANERQSLVARGRHVLALRRWWVDRLSHHCASTPKDPRMLPR
jgi:hypothetical protein